MTTIEGTLDCKLLGFLGKILSDKSSILYQIGLRQLAIKDMTSNSWFISMIKLTFKYNLPSPHQYIQSPIALKKWKWMVKNAVRSHWDAKILSEAATKSTLQLLIQKQPTWKHVEMNAVAINRSRLQARLLTDTFTLQKHRHKFYKEDPTCKLCNEEVEDATHLLLRCSRTEECRKKVLRPILTRMERMEMTIEEEERDKVITEILLGLTDDETLYKLGANACYVITHCRNNCIE